MTTKEITDPNELKKYRKLTNAFMDFMTLHKVDPQTGATLCWDTLIYLYTTYNKSKENFLESANNMWDAVRKQNDLD